MVGDPICRSVVVLVLIVTDEVNYARQEVVGAFRDPLVIPPAAAGSSASRHRSVADVGRGVAVLLADPPWRFVNRTGKVAPEHKRLSRYETMTLGEIKALPVTDFAADKSHLYLWTPNALLADGIPFTDGELAFVAASLFLPSIAP